MALARIITRSLACSRELALDLLARGYAVEIVSPDKVPDNIADLELRVDNGPGDQLIANVEAHDGGRTASLEFVHHLKAPMVNFMRRIPDPGDTGHFSGKPISSNAVPSIERTELPAEAPQPAPRAVSLEVLPDRELDPGIDLAVDPGIDLDEGACHVAPQVLSPPPVQPPGHFAVDDAAVSSTTRRQPMIVPLAREVQLSPSSAGWPWRAALTFAGIALLAVVLGLGMRRTRVVAQVSGSLPVEKTAVASNDVNTNAAEKGPARDLGRISSPHPPATVDSEENSSHSAEEEQVAKVATPTASPRIIVSRDDLIARDTVTYLDKHFEPTPKAKPTKVISSGGIRNRTTHEGVVAANTVTYFNRPSPKAAK